MAAESLAQARALAHNRPALVSGRDGRVAAVSGNIDPRGLQQLATSPDGSKATFSLR